MGWLKGPRISGVIEINTPVKFNKQVQSAMFEPWADVWYVDATDGSDSYTGRGPAAAKATIQAAVTAAGVGDIIYVRPQAYVVGTGHARYTENVTVALAKSDLSIIGVGFQRNNEFGVRVKTSTTGYCFDVLGPSFHMENIGLFAAGGTGCVHMENDGATNTKRGSDGYVFYNCNFKSGTALCVGGQAGRFVNCVFLHASGTLTIATPGVSGYGQQIRNCVFLDNNGSAVTGPYLNASGAHVYNLVVDNCHFQQIPSGGKYIVMGGTLNTGIISSCFFEDDDLNPATMLTLGGTEMRLVGSYDYAGIIA